MDVSMEHVEGVAKVLSDKGFAVNYWRRGTPYTDDGVRYCDIFVVILPDMRFEFRKENLPMGTKKELSLANYLYKDMYLGYRTADGNYRIYDLNYDVLVRGITGTAGDIFKHYPQEIKKAPTPRNDFTEVVNYFAGDLLNNDPVKEFDERLLLFYKPSK